MITMYCIRTKEDGQGHEEGSPVMINLYTYQRRLPGSRGGESSHDNPEYVPKKMASMQGHEEGMPVMTTLYTYQRRWPGS